MKAANIIVNALNPANAREMAHKLALRWRERRTGADRARVRQWCRAHSVEIADWAAGQDPELWREACSFGEEQRWSAEEKLRAIGADLGGGGAYHLLYFLTRLLRPTVVVETGVAAGFSSRAFLCALRRNGQGRLHSSDFPYFRLRSPEQYVGVLVEQELRGTWRPLLAGDRVNLPVIADRAARIDLVHYDSDKSHEGRAFALRTLGPRLAPEAVLLFDDIQDNWHFRDLTLDRPFLVFEFEGKWVGMAGGPERFYQADPGRLAPGGPP